MGAKVRAREEKNPDHLLRSRNDRVSLPSSLTVNHSSALEYSSRLRVSVCGTGAA